MFFLIPLPFIAVGCLCFVLCAAIPPLRRFALASSMWFAAWGCILMLASIVLTAVYYGADALRVHLHYQGNFFQGPNEPRWETGFIVAILLGTAIASAGCVLLHGFIMRRITFQLFRVYLIAVAFSVGLLTAAPFTFALAGGLNAHPLTLLLTAPLIPILAAALAWLCFVRAQDFRARRPETLNPIAPEEYAPTLR